MAYSESRNERTNVAAPSLLAVANDRYIRHSNAQSESKPIARTSSLLSSAVTRLRHSDIPSAPLLTLKLSSPSFLDCFVTDEHEELLYSIRTAGRSTTIKSTDSRIETDANMSTADIKWPMAGPRDNRASDCVEIQLRGARWLGSGKLLRHGTSPLHGYVIALCLFYQDDDCPMAGLHENSISQTILIL
jgi:hypothetical protein